MINKNIFQPAEGYVIPQNGTEILNEGNTVAIRFDIAKYTQPEPSEGMEHEGEQPQQYECEFIRIPRSDYSYAGIVSAIVRSRYSESAVEAIVLNGTSTAEHKAEYNALQDWRKHAKEVAKAVLGE